MRIYPDEIVSTSSVETRLQNCDLGVGIEESEIMYVAMVVIEPVGRIGLSMSSCLGVKDE